MSYDIVVTLTDTEKTALEYAALDVDFWVVGAAKNRADIAIKEIVDITVTKCLENNVQIPGTREEIVALAFQQGWCKTVAQRNQEKLEQSPSSNQ